MQRKEVRLTRDATLWEEGDAARDVAVLVRGRLGVRGERGLVGIVLPNMIVGESALFSIESQQKRTAAVVALEDDVYVSLHPAQAVRHALESGDDSLMRQIQTDLVAQICRNLLMVVAARRGYPFVDEPLMALVNALIRDAQRTEPLKSWEAQMLVCRFLYDLRETSDRLLDRLGPDPSQRVDMIVHASQLLTQLQAGHDMAPLLEAFLDAEKQKNDWWARGG